MNAREIASLLGGNVAGPDRVLAPGPGHSRHDRSLSIRLDHDAPDGFWVNSFAGDDWRACRDHVCAVIGIRADKPKQVRPYEAVASSSPPLICPEVKDRPSLRRFELASRLWQEAPPIGDTLAATYLVHRGLKLPDDLFDGRALRHHPACPFYLADGSLTLIPAMLACMTDIRTNGFRGVHRTALHADGFGKSTLPGLGNSKRMLGQASGACIKLSADEDVMHGLHLAEGIETALACRAMGFTPIWAAMSSGGIAGFPVLSSIDCLTIFADNDVSQAGMRAARQCAWHWSQAGRECMIIAPPLAGSDWASGTGEQR